MTCCNATEPVAPPPHPQDEEHACALWPNHDGRHVCDCGETF